MNTFNLFKQVDKQLIEKAGIKVGDYHFYSNIDDSLEKFESTLKPFGTAVVTDMSSEWSPNEHNLIIEQIIEIEKPNELFGINGVTLEKNTIGIGMHIYSKDSMFQQTISKSEIVFNSEQKRYLITQRFPKASLRGKVVLETFFYLKDIVVTYETHADLMGMKLSKSNLSELLLITDGDASIFPIGEFEENNGPLWKVEFSNFDAAEDSFSYENIRLLFNTSHKLFNQVKAGKTAMSRAMMTEIMSQVMLLIIAKVKEDQLIELENVDNVMEGSILSVVQYWLSTFEINNSSLVDVSNSLHTRLYENMEVVNDD